MEQLYRVVIVDDEIIARIGIKSLITWEDFGYTIIGEAENGKKALDLIRHQQPHLVITDIKMPVEDGITLIKNIKKEGIECEILVLSAFDDFDYVKEALQLGAYDYLRKLEIEANDLIQCLIKVKDRIANNKIRYNQSGRLYDEDNMDAIRQQILRKLLYGTQLETQELTLLKQCQIHYQKDFVVIMIRLDVNKESILWRKEVVNNLFEEILSDYKNSYLCETGVDELSIFHSIKSHGGYQQRQELIKMTNRIMRVMNQYLNLEVFVTVSSEHKGMENIALGYLQAYQAYQMKHMYNKDMTLFYKDILISKSIENYDVVEEAISNLERSLESGQVKEVQEILKLIAQSIQSMEYFEVNHLRYLLSSIIYIIDGHFSKLGINTDGTETWGDGDKKYLVLESITVKNDFTNWVLSLSKSIEKIYSEIENYHVYIVKAKKMIQENYWNQMRIQDIAEQFGMSPNYLSHLFKKETGETFKTYLTTVRIERAKKQLIQTTDTIAEIASQVGYDNERYFSRVFKEKEGVSPSHYRKRGKVHLS